MRGFLTASTVTNRVTTYNFRRFIKSSEIIRCNSVSIGCHVSSINMSRFAYVFSLISLCVFSDYVFSDCVFSDCVFSDYIFSDYVFSDFLMCFL